MKKLLLTLMSILIIFTSTCLSLQAEEVTITKEYLKETLGMNDEEIIASGLAYVYNLGDEITLNLSTDTDLDCGNDVLIPKDTSWNITFEVAGKGVDRNDLLTLISKDALPIGTVKLDTTSDVIKNTLDMWFYNFLNEKVYNMFSSRVKDRIYQAERVAYAIAKVSGSETFKNLEEHGTKAILKAYPNTYVWLPSAKELGHGDTYTVNEGTISNVEINTLGKAYPLYSSSPKKGVVKSNDEDVTYWLREDFNSKEEEFFLNTTNTNTVSHSAKQNKANGIVIGIDVSWNKDSSNKIAQDRELVTGSSKIDIDAYEPSTYAVDLPERVTLTKDFTQFEYVVTGDLENNKKVVVDMPKTSNLLFDGGFYKKDIILNIFNGKMSYDRFDCAINDTQNGTTTTVSIKNEAPSAGKWIGSLPVTISLEDIN